jgi:hypothetical protein
LFDACGAALAAPAMTPKPPHLRHRDQPADFSGHRDRQPGASLVNAEASINRSPDRYDLIRPG